MQNRIPRKPLRKQVLAWFSALSAADLHGRPQQLLNRLETNPAQDWFKSDLLSAARFFLPKGEESMQIKQRTIPISIHNRPRPPQQHRIRSIHGSFSWIDHRFMRNGFDQGLTRLEKLLYFVLIAVSNQDGVSFYSDERMAEILDIRHAHELGGARNELIDRDLIAFEQGIYQVLDLPSERH